MYEAAKISLSRNQLAAFLPNHEAIKEFERLFRQDTDLTALINNIIEGAGLEDNGNYIVPEGSNFLDDTVSLYNAILTLDEEAQNFSYNFIDEPLWIKEKQQMAVFGYFELNSDINVDGELILGA